MAARVTPGPEPAAAGAAGAGEGGRASLGVTGTALSRGLRGGGAPSELLGATGGGARASGGGGGGGRRVGSSGALPSVERLVAGISGGKRPGSAAGGAVASRRTLSLQFAASRRKSGSDPTLVGVVPKFQASARARARAGGGA